MFDFESQLNNLPDSSGVYIMKDADGTIIYVGKAKVLRNRVRQYFKGHNHTPKVASMIENIASFEYIMTDSELEALVLENNLIKEHMPKYNILLKDDKTYPFIKVTMQEEYPKIIITRTVKKDGSRYFGPYSSAILLRELVDLIKEIYKIRGCNKTFPKDFGKGRTCLYYHIGKCLGVCRGNGDKQQYDKMIKDVCSFLNGNYDRVLKNLTQQMNECARNMDFEKAAQIRDWINGIDVLSQKQKIVSATGDDIDAIALYSKNNKTCVQVFFIRSGKIIGREHYIINETDGVENGTILSDFIKQYYSTSSFVPKEILLQYEIDDSDIIRDWLGSLQGRSVTLKVPKKGENLKLLSMIEANAQKELNNLELKILRDIKFKNKALASLYKTLELSVIPNRIEAYDISNTSGTENVGAMVTFIDAKPSSKHYKNFKIKNVDGADDYACLNEVLTRRLEHGISERAKIDDGLLNEEKAKFLPMPDVVFVDGGQGHVNIAYNVMKKLSLDIPVFGIVKDDRHRTRGIVNINGEIPIEKNDEAFMLLVNIQDEMHRRAISYHKNLHTKKNLKSELENIPGVGQVRRKELLKHFKSINNIKNASVDEIAAVKSIDIPTAENIVSYFKTQQK